jgi:hypothetical protein
MGREEILSGDDENIMGALAQQFGGALQRFRQQPAGRTVSAPRFSMSQLANQVGGGAQNNKLRAPLGLGFHTFTAAGVFKFVVEP